MLTVRNALVLCMILATSWSFAGTPPVILSDAWADVGAASVVATDADGDVLTYTWSMVSGPGTVVFAPNGTTESSTTDLEFSEAGTYVLQVAVSDGSAATVSTVTTTIPPVAYVASPGKPQVNITGPTTLVFDAGDSINFTAEAYSLDTVTGSQIPLTGNEISWSSSLDGPLSQTGSSIFVTSLKPGVHVITCTGTNAGGTTSDTIQITINTTLANPGVPPHGGCSFGGQTDATSLWPIMLAILAGLAFWQRQRYASESR